MLKISELTYTCKLYAYKKRVFAFLGVCRSILVFHQLKNIMLHLIFVYFIEIFQVYNLREELLKTDKHNVKVRFFVEVGLLKTWKIILSLS